MKNDVESAVVVPLLQAAVTGILASVGVLSGCVVWRWPVGYAGLSGCLVMGCAWLYFRNEVRTRLDVESGVVQVQAAQVIQAQPEPARAFTLEVDYNEGRAGDFLEFGVDAERFTQWARGVSEGRSLAQAGWIGKGGLFSRSEYCCLLAELLNRGYIRRRSLNGHAQGYEPTSKGAATFRGFATLAHAHARRQPKHEIPRGVRLN